DENATKQQIGRFETLAKVNTVQEVMIHDMALNRLPADVAFPPPLDLKDFQRRVSKHQLVLAFYNGTRGVIGFAIAQDRYISWQIENPGKLTADIADMLKHLGNVDRHKAIDGKVLKDEVWKAAARRIMPIVTNNAPEEAWDQFHELI